MNLNAIIKVGKSSNLRLLHTKSYRAITYKDVESLIDKHKDISFIVFEDMKESDIDKIKAYSIERNIYCLGIVNKEDNSELYTSNNIVMCKNTEEVKRQIEKEFKTYVGSLDFEGNTDRTIENKQKIEETQSISETESTEKVETLKKDIDKQNKELEKLSVEIKQTEDINNTLKLENNTLRDEIRELNVDIEELKQEVEIKLSLIKDILDVKNLLEKEKNDLTEKLDRIKLTEDVIVVTTAIKEIEEYKDKLQTITEELSFLTTEKNNLEVSISEKDNKIVELEEKLNTLEEENSNLKNELSNINNSFAELKDNNESLKLEFIDVNNTFNDLTDKYNTEQEAWKVSENEHIENIDNLTINLEEANKEIKKLKLDLNDTLEKLNNTNLDLELTEEDVNRFKGLLENAELLIKQQSDELQEFKNMELQQGINDYRVLESKYNTIINELGSVKRERDIFERKIDTITESLNKANSLNETLKIKSKSMTSMQETLSIECEYSGKAMIIPVFGSGSYGTTTTAISIAKKLQGKVLFMDLDLTSPKADNWFKISPVIAGVEINGDPMLGTSLGAFVELGVDYVIDNEKRTIIVPEKLKAGHVLNYFSGLYSKVDTYKILGADFSQLLTYFGNQYDFIVVDLGRLGGSDVSNALIRMFDTISTKNVVVTLHNTGDMRSMALRINNHGISQDKLVWVLNLSSNGKIDDIMQAVLNKSKYTILEKNMTSYGMYDTYDEIRSLKANVDKIVTNIIGGNQ